MSRRLTTEQFIEKAKKVHGDTYDYSKVNYIDSHSKIRIICHKKDNNGIEHGEFLQSPTNHLCGKGCPICGHVSTWDSRGRITTEKIISKFKNIHGDKFDYSKVEYKGANEKVCIICKEHGEFWQTPSHHLSGQGCPKCKIEKFFTQDIYLSKGEKEIMDWLSKNNIEYKHNNLIQIDNLNVRPDFIINNIYIEYNGKQHYEFSKLFHKTELGFLKQQYRDQKLREYCKENNIKLVEIRYDQNVEEELEKIKDKLKNGK